MYSTQKETKTSLGSFPGSSTILVITQHENFNWKLTLWARNESVGCMVGRCFPNFNFRNFSRSPGAKFCQFWKPAWMIHATVLCRIQFAIRCFDSTYKNLQQNQNKQISTWIQRWLRILMRVNSEKHRWEEIARPTLHIAEHELAQERRFKRNCKNSVSIVCSECLLINFSRNGNTSTWNCCAFHWKVFFCKRR